jgi:hypothetical protein
MELRFKLKTFGFDTMLNHQLSKKLKLIGRGKFNYLINILTISDVLDPHPIVSSFGCKLNNTLS